MESRLVAKYWQSIVVGLAALASASPAFAEESCADPSAGPDRLTVRVEGVRSTGGQVAITLYPDDSARFMASGGRIARVRAPAAKGAVSVCVPLPGPGHYAILVHHDEDGDRKMDRSLVGLPTEGWGFSNNPTGLVGIPPFAKVRFEAKAGTSAISVQVNY